MLVNIRNAYEAGEHENVITLYGTLHAKYNGTPEDTEAEDIAKASQNELDRIAAEKKAEEERLAEEAKKTAQDKARELIRLFKLSVGSPNSAGGVSLFIGYTNMSDKVIKYCTFTVEPYNKVGDEVECDIRGYSTYRARDDGPHAKGEGISGDYSWYWENAWYNWSISEVRCSYIYIEYMDGTTESLSGDEIGYVMY